MKSTPLAVLGVLGVLGGMNAAAADYKCTGNRVEKSGVTQYTVRRAGPDVTLEKGGQTRGRALRQGEGFLIEVNGSTAATLQGGHVYREGARWGTVTDAQRQYDCPDSIAVTLWVLEQLGEL